MSCSFLFGDSMTISSRLLESDRHAHIHSRQSTWGFLLVLLLASAMYPFLNASEAQSFYQLYPVPL